MDDWVEEDGEAAHRPSEKLGGLKLSVLGQLLVAVGSVFVSYC